MWSHSVGRWLLNVRSAVTRPSSVGWFSFRSSEIVPDFHFYVELLRPPMKQVAIHLYQVSVTSLPASIFQFFPGSWSLWDSIPICVSPLTYNHPLFKGKAVELELTRMFLHIPLMWFLLIMGLPLIPNFTICVMKNYEPIARWWLTRARLDTQWDS